MRVLIVDDSKIALLTLQNVLVQGGYEVLTAADGHQAMAILRENTCRLVISDWEMPQMNGIELCRAIRSEDMLGYVYVILLTMHNQPQEKVEGLRAQTPRATATTQRSTSPAEGLQLISGASSWSACACRGRT